MSRARFGILLLALVGAALVSGFRPLYLLLYVFAGVTVVAYAWARLQGAVLAARIDLLDDYPQAGEPLRLRISVEEGLGLRRTGLRVGLHDDQLGPDGRAEAQATLDITAGHVAWWTASLEGYRRGMNVVGPVTVESSDPLGMVRLARAVGSSKRVLVYPRTLALPGETARGLGMGGESTGALRRVKGVSAAARVREYVHGDSLSHIHWPTSARLDRLMTRELDDGGLGDEVWIVLDLHGAVQAGTGDESTEEYAITLAASLASALLETEAPLGLLARGDRLYHVAPGRGPEQRATIMEALAMARATGYTPLSKLLEEHAQTIGAGGHVLLVAPWSGEELEMAIAGLIRRGSGVVPLLMDGRSFETVRELGSASGERATVLGAPLISRGDDLRRAHELAVSNVGAAMAGVRS